MKVVRAKSAGFCWGVRRAIEAAERAAREGGGASIRTDGPLIHNAREVARLAALGVVACADPAALPKGATLLVRAHGIPPARRAWLDALGLRVVDATCPNVTRIQRACAAAGLERLLEALESGAYDVVIADEINCALMCGLLTEADLARIIDARPASTELVFTGRGASPAILARADLVTEMRAVKHYYADKGLPARKGIEE